MFFNKTENSILLKGDNLIETIVLNKQRGKRARDKLRARRGKAIMYKV